MATKWVDNNAYIGPDRRRRPARRVLDRRRYDDAGELPPLGAMLRRLRVRVTSGSAEDRRHALEMFKAAIGEANRLGWRRCAAALMSADEAFRTGGPQSAGLVEAWLIDAMDHAGAGR